MRAVCSRMYIIYSFEISTVVNREIVWASIRPD